MSPGWCMGIVVDEDGGRVCECGDEGRLCESCAKHEAAYWADEHRRALLSEVNPAEYEQELRDAGRGHLVKP